MVADRDNQELYADISETRQEDLRIAFNYEEEGVIADIAIEEPLEEVEATGIEAEALIEERREPDNFTTISRKAKQAKDEFESLDEEDIDAYILFRREINNFGATDDSESAIIFADMLETGEAGRGQNIDPRVIQFIRQTGKLPKIGDFTRLSK
jgi:hypothetical protein